MPAGRPFIIYSLGRSRSFWLSKFLSYGGYHCAHDQIAHVRSMADVRSWFSQDFTGTAETAAAPWWRLVHDIRPDLTTIVVRRPVKEVVESFMSLNLGLNRKALTHRMKQLDRRLDQIEANVPQAIRIQYALLDDEAICEGIFKACTGMRFDREWYRALRRVNHQVDVAAQVRYCKAYAPQLHKAFTGARAALCGVIARQHAQPAPDGITFQTEDFETFWRDGQALFAEHASEVGPRDGVDLGINVEMVKTLDRIGAAQIITARSNGRMFGYVTSVIGPSLEDKTKLEATQLPFFVSRDARGIGPALQRASLDALRGRGVHEVILKAGVRGSGPKLGSLYRRLGAIDAGHLYNLSLEAT